jgi:hypothetical protein
MIGKDDGNFGIIRSPIRAITLSDRAENAAKSAGL